MEYLHQFVDGVFSTGHTIVVLLWVYLRICILCCIWFFFFSVLLLKSVFSLVTCWFGFPCVFRLCDYLICSISCPSSQSLPRCLVTFVCKCSSVPCLFVFVLCCVCVLFDLEFACSLPACLWRFLPGYRPSLFSWNKHLVLWTWFCTWAWPGQLLH